MSRAWVTLLSFTLSIACGGESTDPGASGGSGGSGASEAGCSEAPACGSCQGCYETCVCETGDGAECIAKCQTASGGSGGGGSGGAAGSSGAGGGGGSGGSSTLETVTIKTTPRPVAPGEEAFFCQNLANPFGKDVDVLQSESFMTPGSHHMFVFYDDSVAQDGPVHDCSGLEYQRTLHSAQTPQHLTKYPPGVGKHVPKATGLRVLAHYLNTTGQVIDAEISVVFQVAPAGTVAQQAGSVFFLNPAIYVGPYQTGHATDTCNVGQDINIIEIVSHMHQFGTKFSAKSDTDQVVYETTDWDEPKPAVYEPALAIPGGASITYRCDYKNTLSTPLTFGESAIDNEMCILSGTYYPAPNGKTLGCN